MYKELKEWFNSKSFPTPCKRKLQFGNSNVIRNENSQVCELNFTICLFSSLLTRWSVVWLKLKLTFIIFVSRCSER